MSSRFRRLTDLFVNGRPVALTDGTYLWVQALNSYQRDECVSDAQVARSRLVMALREKGSERLKIEGKYYETGRDDMIRDLATHRATAKMGSYIEEMRADPDWKERMEILMRTDESDTATPLTHEEISLLATINQAIMDELNRRESEEVAFLIQSFAKLEDAEIIDEWTEDWLENRGSEIAQGEYRLTEIWYATRWCAAVPIGSDDLDHSPCDGHQQKVFETRQHVREVGTELTTLILDALNALNVVGSDPKDSDSQESSSRSSPTRSEAEESKDSTSVATPA
jgi:hypothetical protein